MVERDQGSVQFPGHDFTGVATLHGCWLGGLFVVFLQDFAPRMVDKVPFFEIDVVYARAIYGLMLVLVAFFMPGGVVSGTRKLRARVVQVVPKPPATAGSATTRNFHGWSP